MRHCWPIFQSRSAGTGNSTHWIRVFALFRGSWAASKALSLLRPDPEHSNRHGSAPGAHPERTPLAISPYAGCQEHGRISEHSTPRSLSRNSSVSGGKLDALMEKRTHRKLSGPRLGICLGSICHESHVWGIRGILCHMDFPARCAGSPNRSNPSCAGT